MPDKAPFNPGGAGEVTQAELDTGLAGKQDTATAATDVELAAKQDAATAATDAELSAGLAAKQDAADAATDAEVAALTNLRPLWFDRVLGNNSGSVALATGTLERSAASPMQLLWTPPVDAWVFLAGTFYFSLTTSGDVYSRCSCSPADADGVSTNGYLRNSHIAGGVDASGGGNPHALYKLTGGVPYQFLLGVTLAGGAVGTYYQGLNYLAMVGMGFAR